MATKPLHANQHRAIALLSLGMDMSSVASDCNITRGTLYRWKKDPRFQRALTRQVGEMMGAVVEQVQNQARVLIAGGLDSANKLRQLVLDDYVKPNVKRQACSDILRYQSRFLDMLGFNVKVAEQRRLASEELKDLDDAEPGPENIPPEQPGDIAAKPVSEQAPPNPHLFHHTPPIAEEFRASPIRDDGTPVRDTTEAVDAARSPGAPPSHSASPHPCELSAPTPVLPPEPPPAAAVRANEDSASRPDAAAVPPGPIASPQPSAPGDFAVAAPTADAPAPAGTDPDASLRPDWTPPPHPKNCKKRCCMALDDSEQSATRHGQLAVAVGSSAERDGDGDGEGQRDDEGIT